jgi:hypothetical protein
MILGPLKTYWTEERDNYERMTGQKVVKTNFMKIYGAAHVRAFTKPNILAAFCKMGLVPFNPSVVTMEMMAPSIKTSCKGVLPLVPLTPVHYINNVFRELTWSKPTEPDAKTDQGSDIDSHHHLVQIAASAALHNLPDTDVGFPYSGQPVQSTSQLPTLPTIIISPRKSHNLDLLQIKPATDME